MATSRQKAYIFVIGGPGVGKGTQCALAAQSLAAKHISTGQLLRDEQKRATSPHKDLLTRCFEASIPAPASLITELIRAATDDDGDDDSVVLLDGFPRSVEQLEVFAQEVSSTFTTICLVARDETLATRLDGRRGGSNRADDVPELIAQRVKAEGQNLKLILAALQKKQQPVYMVDAEGDVESVQAEFTNAVKRSVQVSR